MKRILCLGFIMILALSVSAANAVTVTLSGGLDNEALKDKMAKELSVMLTEINDAQAANRNLDFGRMEVSQTVSKSMAMLWENTPFVCYRQRDS